MTVKEVCEYSGISQSSYSRYIDQLVEPTTTTLTKMMECVGLKLVAMDEDIKSVREVPKWGVLSMYVDANLINMCNVFKETCGIFFVSSSENYATLKISLLCVWFHKYNQKTAKDRFLKDVILTQFEMEHLIEKAKGWGLLNTDNSPTSKAYEFYHKMIVSMEDYLSESNIICKIV